MGWMMKKIDWLSKMKIEMMMIAMIGFENEVGSEHADYARGRIFEQTRMMRIVRNGVVKIVKILRISMRMKKTMNWMKIVRRRLSFGDALGCSRRFQRN